MSGLPPQMPPRLSRASVLELSRQPPHTPPRLSRASVFELRRQPPQSPPRSSRATVLKFRNEPQLQVTAPQEVPRYESSADVFTEEQRRENIQRNYERVASDRAERDRSIEAATVYTGTRQRESRRQLRSYQDQQYEPSVARHESRAESTQRKTALVQTQEYLSQEEQEFADIRGPQIAPPVEYATAVQQDEIHTNKQLSEQTGDDLQRVTDFAPVTQQVIRHTEDSPRQPSPISSNQAFGYQQAPQQQTNDLIAQALLNMHLPKPELMVFDGNSKNWVSFLNNFETSLASRVADPAVKLTYLIQHCSGEAKKAIQDCVLLPPIQGYETAMNTLRDRFGSNHMIARSYICDLTSGPRLASLPSKRSAPKKTR